MKGKQFQCSEKILGCIGADLPTFRIEVNVLPQQLYSIRSLTPADGGWHMSQCYSLVQNSDNLLKVLLFCQYLLACIINLVRCNLKKWYIGTPTVK